MCMKKANNSSRLDPQLDKFSIFSIHFNYLSFGLHSFLIGVFDFCNSIVHNSRHLVAFGFIRFGFVFFLFQMCTQQIASMYLPLRLFIIII